MEEDAFGVERKKEKEKGKKGDALVEVQAFLSCSNRLNNRCSLSLFQWT
jgi:hypothetical protein